VLVLLAGCLSSFAPPSARNRQRHSTVAACVGHVSPPKHLWRGWKMEEDGATHRDLGPTLVRDAIKFGITLGRVRPPLLLLLMLRALGLRERRSWLGFPIRLRWLQIFVSKLANGVSYRAAGLLPSSSGCPHACIAPTAYFLILVRIRWPHRSRARPSGRELAERPPARSPHLSRASFRRNQRASVPV
jgi:hypothetical protein